MTPPRSAPKRRVHWAESARWVIGAFLLGVLYAWLYLV